MTQAYLASRGLQFSVSLVRETVCEQALPRLCACKPAIFLEWEFISWGVHCLRQDVPAFVIHDQEGGEAKYAMKNAKADDLPAFYAKFKVKSDLRPRFSNARTHIHAHVHPPLELHHVIALCQASQNSSR